MPIYEYRCQECQQIFEQWQRDFNDQDKSCPVCGGKSQRQISNTSFVLKGSGWYVTDYCNKTGKSGDNGKRTEATQSTAETPAKESAEAKPSGPSTTNPASE